MSHSSGDNEQDLLLMGCAVLEADFLGNRLQKNWLFIVFFSLLQAEYASNLHSSAAAKWKP